MTKIQMLSRNRESCTREKVGDHYTVTRNPDPNLHPLQNAIEYTRALNATKLERLFAKPFLAALEGHEDGIYAMAKDYENLLYIASGSADGIIKKWDLSSKKCIWTLQAHPGPIKGISFIRNQSLSRDDFDHGYSSCQSDLLSCGANDKIIKLWSMDNITTNSNFTTNHPLPITINEDENESKDNMEKNKKIRINNNFQGIKFNQTNNSTNLKATFTSNHSLAFIDSHRNGKMFATCGTNVSLWDLERAEPVHVFCDSSMMDTNTVCRFNRAETNLLACSAHDRSITLFDTRMQTSLGKVILRMRSNSLSWNPQEPIYFAAANEDHNGYVFDMRFLDKSINVLKGHVGAILDIDYSPTGRELVTASYDRTLRIFNSRQGFSRDVYYNRRMQRLFCAKFTMDSKYVLSGSDDGVIRLWKAVASDKIAIKSFREQSADNYSKALKEKFKHMPEISRISHHRRIPKAIASQAKTEHVQRENKKKKLENRIKHSKPDTVQRENIKKDVIVTIKK